MDGTPIFDIKPYVPLADCRTEAAGGFSDRFRSYELKVEMEDCWKQRIPQDKLEAVRGYWPRIPDPLTRAIRKGCTVWNLPDWRSSSGWTGRS